jgi:O-antigen/teichoic acid export membrane protein
MAIGREKEAVNTLVFANIANFVLNLIFIKLFGLLGAVYGTVVSQALFLGATVYYLRDVLPKVLPPMELARSLVRGTLAWVLTALAVLWLENYVKPDWADNLYFLTLYLLYKTGIIKVEGFRI